MGIFEGPLRLRDWEARVVGGSFTWILKSAKQWQKQDQKGRQWSEDKAREYVKF